MPKKDNHKLRLLTGEAVICCHTVTWWFDIKNHLRTSALQELLESRAEARILECIINGYRAGELHCNVENFCQVSGGWEIVSTPQTDVPMAARKLQVGRICFDVTLKGYSGIDALEEPDNPEAIEEAERLLNELVKWVVAPTREALDAFIKHYGLMDYLDAMPYPMSEHASMKYTISDGVDFILDSHGHIIEGIPEHINEWRKEANRALKLLEEI